MITDQFIADVVATVKTTVEQANMAIDLKDRRQSTKLAKRSLQDFVRALADISEDYWESRELSDELLKTGDIIKLDPKIKDILDQFTKLA